MTRLTRPLIRPLTRSIMLGLSDRGISFYVGYLFANGQQGAWYDPYDFSTLFQDAGGTTPDTAVEQPVGLMLDKSGNGNHATQATAAARPVLSARKNLLTSTENVAVAPWMANAGITSRIAETVTLPDGSTGTAYRIKFNSTTGVVSQSFTAVTGNGTVSSWVRTVSGVDSVRLNASGAAGPEQGISETWSRLTRTLSGASQIGFQSKGAAPTGDIYVFEPQAEAGSTATRYQRVNTSTDYDTVGFPHYARFDGVDDSLASTTGGGASTAAFLCMGFRQLSNGASNVIWSDRTGNTGLKLEVTAGGLIAFSGGNGAAIITATGGAVTLNTDYVVTALYDGVNLSVQLNDAAATTAACVLSAGTAGFTIGKDNGAASGFANIRTYQTIYVKDDMPTAQQINETKRFVAGKSGVTL